MEKENVDQLMNLCSRRGIIIPSFKIYGELAGFYDYGPIGLSIKSNLKSIWRKTFVKGLGSLEIESTIVGYDKVYQASGHIKTFTDPILKCTKCGSTYRADKLLEEFFEKQKNYDLAKKVGHMTSDELQELVSKYNISCPKCKGEFSKITAFNLMMKTEIGPTGGTIGYLRPETAQGIFVDFKELYKSYNFKLPIGIAQEGKVFRNEISPRQILIRMREFSQMELEYFFNPEKADELPLIENQKVNDEFLNKKIYLLTREDQEKGEEAKKVSLSEALELKLIPNKIFSYMIYKESLILDLFGINEDLTRFRILMADELPHYSKGNIDLEIKINGKYEEVAGNAYRSDFDLSNHSRMSNTDMAVLDGGKSVLPHVIEVSFGLDRLFWAVLSNNLYKDEKRGWEVLMLNKSIQPFQYAVYPLQKDDSLIQKSIEAQRILQEKGYNVFYKETGSIGKRYAKADEIGIGKCVTIDYNTLEDGTVTIRDISDASQVRVKLNGIGN